MTEIRRLEKCAFILFGRIYRQGVENISQRQDESGRKYIIRALRGMFKG